MSRSVLRLAVLFVAVFLGSARADTIWQQWLNSLQRAGYAITKGSVAVTTPAYCIRAIIPVLGVCNANDPSDPYVLPLMPFGAGYVDPYYGALGEKTLRDGTQVGIIFQLAQTDAELVVVDMPPPAAYFSFQNDVYTRPSSDYPHGPHVLSLDPARGEIRATYNNSTNNADIRRQSGVGFGQGTVAIITTANADLARDMRRRFAALGGDPALIFTAAVGANINPGLDFAADDFNSLMRYLGPQDKRAAHDWLEHVDDNVLVYRVGQPAGLAVDRYPQQTLFSKLPYAADETVYTADLAELSQLLKGWLATQENNPSYQISSFGVSEFVSPTGDVTGQYGPGCIATGGNCVGDQQDTAAYFNRPLGKLGPNQAFVVDGVIQAVTGNAAFTSLSVIDGVTNMGIIGVSQTTLAGAGFRSGTLAGSASAALHDLGLWDMASRSLRQHASRLYVQIFSRGCTAQQAFCSEPFTSIISDTSIPYDDRIFLTARAYLLPGSTTGANPTYLLPPQAIN